MVIPYPSTLAPFLLFGSLFQKEVWEELKKIPQGETRSYRDISKALGRKSSFRAVAQANGANQLAIVIPCHRVINANGELGGYSSGVIRKKWLLNHEGILNS
jgi:AraC family transcriptional regulator of adaptative response/methylated-DNA-[protein]-cysteine methyltransferase